MKGKSSGMKKHQFSLNVTNARSLELPLLLEICAKFKYLVIKGKKKQADMHWLWPLSQTENYEAIMNVSAMFNRLPGLNVVSNKRHCALLFRRLLKNYGSEFDFSPCTFLLPDDKIAL